jgi:hypothetical protein
MMRYFHLATCVILALQCSTSLCFVVVLPFHELQRTTRQVLSNGFPGTIEFSTGPGCPALNSSRRQKFDSTPLRRRLRSSFATWPPLQTFLKTGKSIAGFFRARRLSNTKAALVCDTEKESTDEVTAADDSIAIPLPQGPRWAVAHPSIDLSGTWKPIITTEFQREYNQYLTNCGTTMFFRQVCLKFCSTTREIIEQLEDGRVVHLNAQSPAGGWKRSLISSGADGATESFEAVHSEFLDPDKELVKVEAWWEDQGRIHKSVLREKAGVQGGVFETLRYLTKKDDETDQAILVTESTFHPSPKHLSKPSSKFKPAFVRWQYEKE